MFEKSIEVVNDTGLHARPAALFVQAASRYKSSIWLEKEEKKVSAKSIMGIMSLGVAKGIKIKISAEGIDEEPAVEELITLVKSKFGESL